MNGSQTPQINLELIAPDKTKNTNIKSSTHWDGHSNQLTSHLVLTLNLQVSTMVKHALNLIFKWVMPSKPSYRSNSHWGTKFRIFNAVRSHARMIKLQKRLFIEALTNNTGHQHNAQMYTS